MISEFLLNVTLIVAVVSLITMLMLFIFGVAIPTVLIWIFGMSLLFTVATLLYTRKNKGSNL